MRVVVDKHVTRFPDAPGDTWLSAINEIVNLNFPAFGQEVLPKLAPDLDHADKDTMTLTLGALYRPLLAQAAEYGLCPSNLDVVNFHFGIIARIRPFRRPQRKSLPTSGHGSWTSSSPDSRRKPAELTPMQYRNQTL